MYIVVNNNLLCMTMGLVLVVYVVEKVNQNRPKSRGTACLLY